MTALFRPHKGLAAVVFAAALGLAGAVHAKTFKWAADSDPGSMDPHSRNVASTLSMLSNIYEPLIRRSKELALEPALAVKWEATSPTTWRFTLRQGVKWQDGSPFTADDVVFTYGRTKGPGSLLATVLRGSTAVKKIDDHTVEFTMAGPNPTFPQQMSSWLIMSKAWSEKNNTTKATDLTKNEVSFSTMNAMGTGPFILKSRGADGKIVMVPNPGWWDKAEHNLTEVIFTPIANPATRSAALLSGEVDMVHTLPVNAIPRVLEQKGLRVMRKAELRTMLFFVDQLRDELIDSSVKGKNPFKDVRVRQAMAMAIDAEAISRQVMRGVSVPNYLLVGPGINAFDAALNAAPKRDIDAAKKLMADAGYANGFEVGMQCSNDRYVNDEFICTAAVAMLARIGIKVNLKVMPFNQLIKFLSPPYETSLILAGWLPATYDAHDALFNLTASRSKELQRGVFNVGGYNNPKLDELVMKAGVELDPKARDTMLRQALQIVRDDVAVIPIHQQVIVWAAKDSVDLVQNADNFFPLRFVKMK
ncbi:MAG: ABC transporter substrate-binding protein [Candidatus Odyssella sp.]|nr:ABC transporter substrate-binding protein [Candidatus Odyssella sp.]